MVTQKDIAAACGVSVAAVNKALHNYPDIGSGTATRILDMARKMGYQQSGGFRPEGANPRRSRMIGLLITADAESFFHHEILIRIREKLHAKGYDLVLLGTKSHIQSGETAVQPGLLARARLLGLDGILLFCTSKNETMYHVMNSRDLQDLLLCEIPVIAVDCEIAGCGCVIPDYKRGIDEILRYLCAHGHRKTAFIYGAGENGDPPLEKALQRTAGELRMDLPLSYFCRLPVENATEAYSCTSSFLEGSRWLLPTCILYGDDGLLQGGVLAILRKGLKIPEDISVASMHFSKRSPLPGRKLTCWETSPEQIAEEAAELLFTEMRSPGETIRTLQKVSGIFREGDTVRER